MQYRHGDVMLERIDDPIPDEAATRLPHTTLAHGEVTGHSHRIAERGAARLHQTPTSLLLEVTADVATLIHEEHHPIPLPRGLYRVWRQREYTPTEIRTIAD